MRRTAALTYGLLCYAAFNACFLYLLGFLNGAFVPKSIDSGEPTQVAAAMGINVGLVLFFGIQHSVMARPGFKRWWTRFVPEPVERSTYVLLSVAAMLPIFAFWQPITTVVWSIESATARNAMLALHFTGVGLLLYSTILIDHFDLFGVRQVWLHFRGRPYTHHPFRTPSLYSYMRHPLYAGWLTALWATPTMTVGHLILTGGFTAYILVAVAYEERDLVAHFGDTYRRYQRTVPQLLPRPGRKAARCTVPEAS
jgi:protein-S-isoprenylcysteine O-methyltransferase Ste14